MDLLETLEFIKEAHKGQVDKAGKPYWKHPYSVRILLGPNATFEEQQLALLHDILEDTKWTAEDLLTHGISKEVVEALIIISKPEEMTLTYMDWIRSIIDTNNELAIKVKYADLMHNSFPWRIEQLPVEEQSIAKRYDRAKKLIDKWIISNNNQDPGWNYLLDVTV